MPCDTTWTTAEAQQEAEDALKELDAELATGGRRISRNMRGEVKINDWNSTAAARAGWCEGCALRAIERRGSSFAKARLAQQGVTGRPFVAASHNGHKH